MPFSPQLRGLSRVFEAMSVMCKSVGSMHRTDLPWRSGSAVDGAEDGSVKSGVADTESEEAEK